MNFYKNLIYILTKRNISQNQLIRHLKLGKNAVIQWKNNDNIPGGETLLKISNYLHVPVDYLLGNMDSFLSEDYISNELDDEMLTLLIERLSDEAKKRSRIKFPTGEQTEGGKQNA